jgi:hypothetical protein
VPDGRVRLNNFTLRELSLEIGLDPAPSRWEHRSQARGSPNILLYPAPTSSKARAELPSNLQGIRVTCSCPLSQLVILRDEVVGTSEG